MIVVLLKTTAICFFVKKFPAWKICRWSILYNISQNAWLLLPTKCIFVTIAVKWSNFFLCRMGKALCERPFALHRLKPEKHKQNVDVVPSWKNFCGHQWKGLLGPFPLASQRKFSDHCCTQYSWMDLQQVKADQDVSQIKYDWWNADKFGNDIYWKWNY